MVSSEKSDLTHSKASGSARYPTMAICVTIYGVYEIQKMNTYLALETPAQCKHTHLWLCNDFNLHLPLPILYIYLSLPLPFLSPTAPPFLHTKAKKRNRK
eukprot:GEMP01119464.1.p1 GENE.GEMP01119464.1~~GEMP01119464.1.p1  ORF type:complete len:100 (-),score=1.64 GEMP01119464.1:58-357(-)